MTARLQLSIWVLGAASSIAGCDRRAPAAQDPPPGPRPVVVAHDAAPLDARLPPRDDAALRAFLDGLEPTEPALPPVVRQAAHGDCQPSYAPRPNRDDNPMCKVDGGMFVMTEAAARAAGLARKVTVQGFYVDQFEVTADQFTRFLNVHGNDCSAAGVTEVRCTYAADGPPWAPFEVIGREGGRYKVIEDAGDHAVFVTPEAAVRYCTWAGKQLVSEAQWEYAGRHDPRTRRDYLYSWGDAWDEQRAYRPDGHVHAHDRGDALAVGTFDGTGGHPDGSSPWGLHDIVSNADEIVARCDHVDDGCTVACGCPVVGRGFTAIPELTERGDDEAPVRSKHPMPFSGFRCSRPL